MKLFDYIYFRLCKYYLKSGSAGFRISGLALLSLIQTLNIFSILGYFVFLIKYIKGKETILGVVLYLLILVLNGFRYNKLHFDILREKYISLNEDEKRKANAILKIYIITSVIVFLFLFIYRYSFV